MKILKWIAIVLGVLLLAFGLLMFQPWVFLPHQHIVIALPFAPADDIYTNLIPMGEKIEHNAQNGVPDGHPGIDFQWNKSTAILAVADGTIVNITKNKNNKYTIEQNLGLYRSVYQEMNLVEPDLHRFSKVKRGQILGYSGTLRTGTSRPKESDPSGQVHWDFGSASMLIDRLCPLNYFDADSKARILKIWANVPANDKFKSQYPDICNGVFKNKED